MVRGQVDLMIMGVGELGQIGFNEPGSYAHSTTRLVRLSYNSRKNQDKFFSNPNEVPKSAITMGMKTIMGAKKIVLMMWGEDKAGVAKVLIEGEANEEYPATCLQEHDVANDYFTGGALRKSAVTYDLDAFLRLLFRLQCRSLAFLTEFTV